MATFECDWINAQLISISISENTTFTFVDPLLEHFDADYRFSYIKVTNSTGSGKQLTWPAGMYWAGSGGQGSVNANRTDIFQIMQVLDFNTGVVTYYGNVFGNNYNL